MFLFTNGKVLWGAVIAAFILSIVFYPFLPTQMPIHYDVATVRI
nr:ybgB [Bacillus subtilis] [Bacillus subtilis subsp. subtilis str. 168]